MISLQKILGIVAGASLAFAVAAPVSRASEQTELTKMTFQSPVEIPGHVLSPGTYYFTRIDNGNDPDINLLEIYSADNHSNAIFVQTETVDRQIPADHTVLTFAPGSKHAPAALIDWFYPGELTGHMFVYSPQKEMQIEESKEFTLAASPSGATPVLHASWVNND
jgi:hypothetical protein